MPLSETQIRRYARHVLLREVGGVGQARLLAAAITIDLDVDRAAAIVAATYLAAAGIGTLVLRGGDADTTADDVAGGIALGQADLGHPLARALATRLRAQNPDVTVVTGTGTPLAIPPNADDAHDGVAGALIRGGLAACHAVIALIQP